MSNTTIKSPVRGQGFVPYIEWRKYRVCNNPRWDFIEFRWAFNWDIAVNGRKKKEVPNG